MSCFPAVQHPWGCGVATGNRGGNKTLRKKKQNQIHPSGEADATSPSGLERGCSLPGEGKAVDGSRLLLPQRFGLIQSLSCLDLSLYRKLKLWDAGQSDIPGVYRAQS